MTQFEPGHWYRNERCRYQVIEIDDDVLHVRLDDDSECLLDAGEQAGASRYAAHPWWHGRPGPRQRAAKELRERGVQHLYHFTALENLQGIRDVGAICSKETLERMDRWPVEVPGGDDDSQSLDKRHGNWPYVSLSLAWCTPQFFNRLDQRPLVSFCVSPEVAGAGGAKIYDRNANSDTRELFRDFDEALDRLNLDLFTQRRHAPAQDSQEWREIQAEALIHDRVPLGFVERIVADWRIPRADVERVFGARFPIAMVNFRKWWHGTLPCLDALQLRFPGPPPDPYE